MFSAFQHSGYQNNSYQIVSSGVTAPAGGGKSEHNQYFNRKYEYDRLRELENRKLELEQAERDKEKEILAMERRRKDRLDDRALQMKLLALLEQQNQLQLELQRIIQEMFDEEEAVLVLLLSLPFVS